MKRKVFVISDTHFFHDNIIKWDRTEFATVEEMHEEMIKQWNDVVGKDDIVLHLGDVAFKPKYKEKEIKEILERLNGKKMLLPGNHDREVVTRDKRYFNNISFASVEKDARELWINSAKVVFSHEPVLHIPDGYINIHGHIHSGAAAAVYGLDSDRINVNVDSLTDYAPIRIDKFLFSRELVFGFEGYDEFYSKEMDKIRKKQIKWLNIQ